MRGGHGGDMFMRGACEGQAHVGGRAMTIGQGERATAAHGGMHACERQHGQLMHLRGEGEYSASRRRFTGDSVVKGNHPCAAYLHARLNLASWPCVQQQRMCWAHAILWSLPGYHAVNRLCTCFQGPLLRADSAGGCMWVLTRPWAVLRPPPYATHVLKAS